MVLCIVLVVLLHNWSDADPKQDNTINEQTLDQRTCLDSEKLVCACGGLVSVWELLVRAFPRARAFK